MRFKYSRAFPASPNRKTIRSLVTSQGGSPFSHGIPGSSTPEGSSASFSKTDASPPNPARSIAFIPGACRWSSSSAGPFGAVFFFASFFLVAFFLALVLALAMRDLRSCWNKKTTSHVASSTNAARCNLQRVFCGEPNN